MAHRPARSLAEGKAISPLRQASAHTQSKRKEALLQVPTCHTKEHKTLPLLARSAHRCRKRASAARRRVCPFNSAARRLRNKAGQLLSSKQVHATASCAGHLDLGTTTQLSACMYRCQSAASTCAIQRHQKRLCLISGLPAAQTTQSAQTASARRMAATSIHRSPPAIVRLWERTSRLRLCSSHPVQSLRAEWRCRSHCNMCPNQLKRTEI